MRQTRAEAPRRPQGKLVDFAAHDEAMEMEGPEALGDDFRNVEAIIGTCTDMCPGEFFCFCVSYFLFSLAAEKSHHALGFLICMKLFVGS